MKILKITAIILTCLSIWTCKKEDVSCPEDQEFCALVNEQDFESTGPIIDDYLSTLRVNQPDENLELLSDWLECMSCVEKVKILCNSCIETYPTQSELQVSFVSNGQSVTMTMDIWMDALLKFRTYHN